MPLRRLEDGIIMARVVDLLLSGQTPEARAALAELSHDDPVPVPKVDDRVANERPPRLEGRPSVRPPQLAAILRRDGWRCHYCGRRLVVAGVIELIGVLCPDEFPFPPGHHMPVARTHPAAIRVYPNVDHVHAGSLGGDWHDPANLIAACTPCNERKSDRLGWISAPPELDDWDGLAGRYQALAELTGEPMRRYHVDWLRALNPTTHSRPRQVPPVVRVRPGAERSVPKGGASMQYVSDDFDGGQPTAYGIAKEIAGVLREEGFEEVSLGPNAANVTAGHAGRRFQIRVERLRGGAA
jgi:hypothetical protein